MKILIPHSKSKELRYILKLINFIDFPCSLRNEEQATGITNNADIYEKGLNTIISRKWSLFQLAHVYPECISLPIINGWLEGTYGRKREFRVFIYSFYLS